MKTFGLAVVREMHRRFSSKPLPDRVSVLFHELERPQWRAFTELIEYFSGQGYRCVDAHEFVWGQGPDKRLFVSFDDNHRSWHEALPLLERTGTRATFYVNTLPFRDTASPAEIESYFDRIRFHGKRAPLSRQELRELAQAGHDIGCHSHSHFVLSDLRKDQWDAELRASKARLEEIVDRPVRHFAFPFGMPRHFSQPLRAYCAAIGFETIAAAVVGHQVVAAADALNLQRTSVSLSDVLPKTLVRLRIDGRLFTRITGRSAA